MSLDVERVVDRCVGLQEPLRRALRLEGLHLSLASSYRETRILGAVVVSQSAWSVTIEEAEHLERGRIRPQSVRRDRLRLDMLVAQQTPHQVSTSGPSIARNNLGAFKGQTCAPYEFAARTAPFIRRDFHDYIYRVINAHEKLQSAFANAGAGPSERPELAQAATCIHRIVALEINIFRQRERSRPRMNLRASVPSPEGRRRWAWKCNLSSRRGGDGRPFRTGYRRSMRGRCGVRIERAVRAANLGQTATIPANVTND